ncbi:hAT family C-terminal dimerization region [Popillia japonica]|uniref:HAT family C-terminal dimerization region n=1 Tax=Popillia japonica TaxID=7064 RepID=A0AAW1L9Y1_POPJA
MNKGKVETTGSKRFILSSSSSSSNSSINQYQEENIINPTIIAEYEAGEDGILTEVTPTSSAPARSNLTEVECPNLAGLAIKLLKIPAASEQIERVFSSWGHVHSFSRNRLTFERSKKLAHIYYTLRISDKEYLNNEETDNE